MEPNDVHETLEALKKAGFFEVYEVTRFHGVRKSKNGVQQEVILEMRDAGPDVANPHLRYHASAFAEGKEASGNTGQTPSEVVVTLHWWDLDS